EYPHRQVSPVHMHVEPLLRIFVRHRVHAIVATFPVLRDRPYGKRGENDHHERRDLGWPTSQNQRDDEREGPRYHRIDWNGVEQDMDIFRLLEMLEEIVFHRGLAAVVRARPLYRATPAF